MSTRTAPDANGESRTLKLCGDAHAKRDEWEEAAHCYRAAVTADRDYVGACVALGFVLTMLRKFAEAERYLSHALALDPRVADAHYFLAAVRRACADRDGVIAHLERAVEIQPDFEQAHRELLLALVEGGRTKEAEEVANRSIERFPGSAEFHFYFGHLLDRQERYDEAINHYQRSLALQPDAAQTHNNLGDVFRKSGQLDRAATCYRRAIALQPDHVDALANLGGILQDEHKTDEAIAVYERALAANPGYAAVHHRLGNAYLEQGDTAKALACYDRAARLDPQSGVAHLSAALSGAPSDRAPSRYVENLFDGYAENFDSHLVQSLRYDTPQRLVALLRGANGPGAEGWSVLDLGCGTGLSGAAIAPYCREIVGVDVSAKMLEKARARNVYRRLEQQDLLPMIEGEPAATYDVVLAADVLVYLGRLDEIAAQVRRALRPRGLFAFSVESLEAWPELERQMTPAEFKLGSTGRYAHSKAYLHRLALENQFEVLATIRTHTRLEKGKPVDAYLGLWQRPEE